MFFEAVLLLLSTLSALSRVPGMVNAVPLIGPGLVGTTVLGGTSSVDGDPNQVPNPTGTAVFCDQPGLQGNSFGLTQKPVDTCIKLSSDQQNVKSVSVWSGFDSTTAKQLHLFTDDNCKDNEISATHQDNLLGPDLPTNYVPLSVKFVL